MKKFIRASTPDSDEYFVTGCEYLPEQGYFDVVNNLRTTVYNIEDAADKVLEYLDDPSVESAFVFLPNAEEVEFDVAESWTKRRIELKLKVYMKRNRNI